MKRLYFLSQICRLPINTPRRCDIFNQPTQSARQLFLANRCLRLRAFWEFKCLARLHLSRGSPRFYRRMWQRTKTVKIFLSLTLLTKSDFIGRQWSSITGLMLWFRGPIRNKLRADRPTTTPLPRVVGTVLSKSVYGLSWPINHRR